MRQIDADAAIDTLKELTANGTNKGMVFGEDAVHRIEMLPSAQPETNCSEIPNSCPAADVVPVVRCDDCVYYGSRRWCELHSSVFDDNAFCSYGERKVGKQK